MCPQLICIIGFGRLKARHDCEHIGIGFDFTFNWLRKWCCFFLPTAEQSKAKPKRMHITLEGQLKTALFWT